ncbi:hypothetical protein BSKO_02142 [Bryopsis sp. KO-2023]|nr:hypothetical protein BSKO_02142 [Bryopsis sp. KO-2023]
MSQAVAWKQLMLRSVKKNSSLPSAKYIQVATVKNNGRPANRTVVFRGFLEDTTKLTFVTDSRSAKIDDIGHTPFSEICWYFPITREQFRLGGQLSVISKESGVEEELKLRQAAWARMSSGGQEQFLWPTPGKPRQGVRDLVQGPVPGDQDPPPETFCLVVMDVEEVDHLQLKGNRRHRYWKSTQIEGGWEEEETNP